MINDRKRLADDCLSSWFHRKYVSENRNVLSADKPTFVAANVKIKVHRPRRVNC